jgi:hypothetical protein
MKIIIKIIYLFLSLPLLFHCVTNRGENSQCHDDWDQWEKDYAANTPFLSLQKTSEWPLDIRITQQILDGQVAIDLPSSLELGDQRISKLNFNTLKGKLSDETRDIRIIQNLQTMVQNNPPKNLLIINTGLIHAFDYFLQNPDHKVTYATLPFRKHSQLFTEEYYALKRTMNDAEPLANARSLSGVPRLAAYYKIHAHSQRRTITRDQLFDVKTQRSSTLMIGDIHPLREPKLARQLPRAECLKQLGFETVTLVQEHSQIYANHQYSYEELRRKIDMTDLLKARIPLALISQIENVQVAPASLALIDKVRSYERSNIPVLYTGME